MGSFGWARHVQSLIARTKGKSLDRRPLNSDALVRPLRARVGSEAAGVEIVESVLGGIYLGGPFSTFWSR